MECSRAHASVAVVFLALFFGEMAATMCFSYLPKLVKKFGTSEVNSAFDVGVISASLHVGWGISGVLWGHAGDVYGHKKVMVVASLGVMCATLAFGFSKTFWWALVVRFLHGIFMGVTVLGKSLLTKVSDRSKVSLAFSIYYSVCTTAIIFGPSFAGFLAFPAEQYPTIFSKESVFAHYEVLLPNLILTMCWLVTIVLELIVIPSDHKEEDDEEQCLMKDSDDHKAENEAGRKSTGSRMENEELINEWKSSKELNTTPATTWSNVVNLFASKIFTTCIILYFVIGTIIASVEEMFPVFAETSRKYHGLDLQTSEVGVVFFGAGVILILSQLLFVRKIINAAGARRSLIGASVLLMFCIPLIAVDSKLRGRTNVVGYATLVMGIVVVLINILLSQINVLISNITDTSLIGAANGIGLTANMLGNIGGPVVYGRLYSWSLQNERTEKNGTLALGFPLDHYFIFIVISLSCLVVALVAVFCLTNGVDEREKDGN